MRKPSIVERIHRLVKEYLAQHPPASTGKYRIPLSSPTFDHEEINEAIDTLLSSRLTMGEKVREFEETFSGYIGTRYGTMVNSGSSANFLADQVLVNPLARSGTRERPEIITPTLTWPTTVSQILSAGLTPVLVDIEPGTYTISMEQLEQAISSRTGAIVPVHTFGNPCEMPRIMKLASENDLLVVEDCCEAHGAEFGGKRVGSFGHMSTFSFYFSHHITTIEGGMLLTNSKLFSELSRALRAHGWSRDSAKNRRSLTEFQFDRDWRFVNLGFNLRPTEIQGAFGIRQLPKLEGLIRRRQANAAALTKRLEQYEDLLVLPRMIPQARQVWLMYPLVIQEHAPITRNQLTSYLEQKGIETRPLLSGNLVQHPVSRFVPLKRAGPLPNAQLAHRNGFAIGIHHGLAAADIEYVTSCFDGFMSANVRR